MRIGDLQIDPAVVLAPMAGVTDSPYRSVARALGCPAVVTEMVSSEGLVRSGRGSLALLSFGADEQPVLAQIFGHRPEAMAEAARTCAASGFAGIDINMGCPVRKVVRSGAGAALLREPQKAARLLAAVRRVTPVPVTAKIRSGWTPEEINAVEVAQRLADAGADALVVHARTRSQFYQGRADWSLIAEVAANVAIPVIGNGDLRQPGDAARMRDETGCAGVMVGRAALGDPWLPGAMAAVLAGRRPPPPPGPDEIARVLCIHLQKMIDWVGEERRAVQRMRKHLVWYTRGIEGAARLRRLLPGLHTAEHMRQALDGLVRECTCNERRTESWS